MTESPVYVASDIHLGAISRRREEAFRRWLEHAADRAGRIVLNGDLFDFWFEFRWGVPQGHEGVLETLRAAAARVPVTLMGGNHDWWGGAYLRDRIGVEFLQDPVVRELAGHRAFLAHGDGLGAGDMGYRLLRLVLRGRLTRWAFAWLPPRLGSAVARRVSATEARGRDPTESEKQRARFIRSWATEKLREERGLDLVILAHTHIPELLEVEPGRWYLNAGDWVHHTSYAVLEPGRPPRILSWDLEADAPRKRGPGEGSAATPEGPTP